jgi:Xaa-Pro aminopeptidase
MPIQNRIQKLRQKLVEKGVDAILVSQPDNLYYLSGCQGLEGYLLITLEHNVVVTDFRYTEAVQREAPNCPIFLIKGKMAEWLPGLFSGFKIRRLALESSHLTLATFEQISGILKTCQPALNLLPVEGLIESLRVVKEPEELALIIEAGKITAAALAYCEKILRPGITEKTLAWEIESFMREKGSQSMPFEVIVGAGPNGALPHARPSDYALKIGEPIVVDIGSRHQSYISDMTRTFCLGKPDDRFHKVYDTALNAQLTAISGIKSGMTGQASHQLALEVITRAGYGEAFGHGLGHGLGLMVHEKPRLGLTSEDILEDGMVFTIEPGIYLSGWGGVRIEDDVVIENGKPVVITSAKK